MTQFKMVVGGVPEHFNLPWHLAIENQRFQALSLNVEFVEMPGGTGQMTRALRDQSIDVAILLTEGGVADILNGNPSSIVKTYVESPLIWGIHVAGASEIQSVEQTQGKTYAISRLGSGSHLMAIVDAAQRGWPTDELKFEPVQNLEGAREALKTNRADTFFWERFTTSPYVSTGEFRRVADRLTLWPAFVVCVRNELLSNQAELIKNMLSLVDHESQWLMDRPDQSCDTISRRYQLERGQVQSWFKKTRWSVDFAKPTLGLETAKEYLLKLGLVGPDSINKEVWFDLGTTK